MTRKPENVGAEPETAGSPAEPVMPYQLRMRVGLKETLERVAEQNSRSLNGEINARLEASFVEPKQIGGPELQDLVEVWAKWFLRGGTMAARAVGMPEEPSQWLRDHFCYRTAAHSASDAVLGLAPMPGPDVAAEIGQEEIKNWQKVNDVFARVLVRGVGTDSKIEEQLQWVKALRAWAAQITRDEGVDR